MNQCYVRKFEVYCKDHRNNRLDQGWAITFLSGPVTENELAYWAGNSKLNTELYGNQKRIYLPITSITTSAHNNTASIPSGTTISGTDVAYCI